VACRQSSSSAHKRCLPDASLCCTHKPNAFRRLAFDTNVTSPMMLCTKVQVSNKRVDTM
jgi:hypothetical protein